MKMLFGVILITIGIGLLCNFESLTLMDIAGFALIVIGLKL